MTERIFNVSQMSDTTDFGVRPAREQALTRVALTRTNEPVWPEDEHMEEAQLRSQGSHVPLLEPPEADAAVAAARVELPDVLVPHLLTAHEETNPASDVSLASLPPRLGGMVPHLLWVPASFDAPEQLTLRRLRLELRLSAEGGPDPVVLWLSPTSDVATDTYEVAEAGVDLGKAVSVLFPSIPDVFTAKVHTSARASTTHPRIQASGLMTGHCQWRVSDPALAYDFGPRLVIGSRIGYHVVVDATLHVEIRKRILGLFHRTYAKNAVPRRYELSWDGGHLNAPDCYVISAADIFH